MIDHDPSQVPSWEDIVHSHGRFIYSVAYRLTGNRDDAEDLVQDVLLRVRRGLASYTPGSLEGWLSRITTNAFLDDVRRKQRRPVDSLGDDADRIVPAAMGADEALDASGLPEHLQQALADLPEEFRVCVVLCDVLGYGYAEIADRLDIPVGTVRSRISRGRSTLRGVLS